MTEYQTYENTTFRAIYTAKEFIFKDLDLNLTDNEIDFLYQKMNDSGIDHNEQQKNRCFQYSLDNLNSSWALPNDKILAPLNRAGSSRFSDGSYGVFYSAEDEETALLEVIFHDFSRAKEYFSATKAQSWTTHKMVYKAKIETKKSVDISLWENVNTYTHPKDYSHSQKIGKEHHEKSTHLIRYPSARSENGFCLAALRAIAIDSVSKSSFITIVLQKSGNRHTVTRADQLDLNFKDGGEPE